MTLEDAEKIQASLTELSPDIEDFYWGPSYDFAMQRRKESLNIIQNEIKKIKGMYNDREDDEYPEVFR